MSKLRELHSCLPDDSTRALGILRNTNPVRTASPGRSRSPRHDQPMAHPDLDTLVSGRQRHRHRRPQETPAPPAHCALPGSWNKDFLQELAREVTMAPWLQWTPTSGPGEHLQLKTRLGTINHWRNGTAHIQGPSSHQLACRILELREALQQETRAPVPHNHSSQAPVAHLVGTCADHVPVPDTSVPVPGPHPLSPASFSPGSSTRFQQNTPASSRRSSGRERDSRSTIFSNSHDSFMPPEGDTSCQQLCAHVGSVGFVYLRHLSCVPSCRGFLTRCPFVKFSCAPVFVCLKGP